MGSGGYPARTAWRINCEAGLRGNSEVGNRDRGGGWTAELKVVRGGGARSYRY